MNQEEITQTLDRLLGIMERYDTQQGRTLEIIKGNMETIDQLLESVKILTDKVQRLESCNCKK